MSTCVKVKVEDNHDIHLTLTFALTCSRVQI